jgi:hypothetical protein
MQGWGLMTLGSLMFIPGEIVLHLYRKRVRANRGPLADSCQIPYCAVQAHTSHPLPS